MVDSAVVWLATEEERQAVMVVKVTRRELKRDLRALGQRYRGIMESREPEDVKEAARLLQLHEKVRMQLVEMGDSGEE